MRPLKVLKFGGTSVGSTGRLRRVVEIVTETSRTHRVVVVASAAAGVTDALVAALDAGLDDGDVVERTVDALLTRHCALAAAILTPHALRGYDAVLGALLETLRTHLNAFRTAPSARLRDEVVAVGERLSVPLVAAALRDVGLPARSEDAAALVRTDSRHTDATVDLEATYEGTGAWYGRLPSGTIPVVTGFIGATASGATTTLGRGGSDYSAALLAAGLRADALERWTDVDGLYTDDPRRNADAKRLACIVLEEAAAWNRAGRLGMHKKALDPLVAAGIPVYVRSTAAPDAEGTVILPSAHHRELLASGF